MIPTVDQVFAAVRGHLGDTGVPGGQLFKDDWLIGNGHWAAAYDALYRWLDRNAQKMVRRTTYFNLPAYTAYVTPAGMGIGNMGKPIEVYERGINQTFNATVLAFNAVGAGTPPSVDLTVTAHGLSSGAQVVAFGFSVGIPIPAINGAWSISVLDANTIRLLGCAATDDGSGIGQAGIVSTGSGLWPNTPLPQDYDLEGEQNSVSSGQLTRWEWEGGAFRFIPASQNRQLKIVFMLSGNAPESGSVGIDDSRDALALFTAASAAASKTGPNGKAMGLWMRAIGNNSGDTTNIRGGAFYELAQLGLQAINMTSTRVPRFRPRRNVGAFPWGGFGA